jgi:hypothetical protein
MADELNGWRNGDHVLQLTVLIFTENEVAYVISDCKETGQRSFEYYRGNFISTSLIILSAEMLLPYTPESE